MPSARLSRFGDNAFLRFFVGALLLGMIVAAVPLARALTVQFTANEQPFVVNLARPSEGANIGGPVALLGQTPQEAKSATFFVSREDGTPVAGIDGQPSSDKTSWTANWNAPAFGAGVYKLTFSAVRVADGITGTSQPVTVNVFSTTAGTVDTSSGTSTTAAGTETTGSTEPEVMTVRIASPPAFAEVSGNVSFSAFTSIAADELQFVYTPAGGGGSFTVNAVASGSSWAATWQTASYPNGIYSVAARAFLDGVIFTSEPISVTLANADAAPAFSIALSSPGAGASVKGDVILAATTSQSATALTFVVKDQSGHAVSTVAAVQGATATQWSGTWDSSVRPNGVYSFGATAMRDGATATSPSREFTLNNPVVRESFGVEVSSPLNGAALSSLVQLSATTAVAVNSLQFVIAQDFGSRLSENVVASGGPTFWTAQWSATGKTAGSYKVIAKATKDGSVNDSAPVSFTLLPASSETANTPVTPRITAPSADAALSSSVTVDVRTDAVADSVQVQLRASSTDDSPAVASAGANMLDTGTSWRSQLSLGNVPAGTYALVAYAVRGTSRTASAPIKVSVGGGTTTFPRIDLLQPASGASVKGGVQFGASSTAALDALTFILEGGVIAGGRLAVPATPNAAKTGWTASWNSASVADGGVSVRAVGQLGAQEGNSTSRTFTVANAAATATTAPAFAVKLLAPVGDLRFDGVVPLSAETSAGALVVRFVIGPATGGTTAVVDGHYDAGAKKWTGSWDSADLNGTYFVTAMAQNETGASAQSARVRVYIGSTLAGEPVPPPPTTATNTNTAPPPPPPSGAPTDTTAPAAQTLPLAVKLVAPPAGAELRGAVGFSAEATQGASVVRFVLRGANGQAVERRATPVGTRWNALFDTTPLPDGSYALEAIAANEKGESAVSNRVDVRIANAPRAAEAPVENVAVLPPNAVAAFVVEAPDNSRVLASDPLPQEVTRIAGELDAKCAAVGIGPDRCADWLRRTAPPNPCVLRGIVVKEECAAYLASLGAPPPPEQVAQSTAGLMTAGEFALLRNAAVESINTTVALPPANPDAPSRPSDARPAPFALAQSVPLVRDEALSVRVHASAGYVADDGVAHQTVPAIILIDSDADGLPDDVETRLGTDPKNKDTDGDSYPDALEIERGYNPLGPGKLTDAVQLAPIDVAIVSGVPIEQPRDTGEETPSLQVTSALTPLDGTQSFTMTGRADPGSIVTVFVYSYLPVVFTTTANDDGTWSYEVDAGLADGSHEAYATITDDTGKIQQKSSPLSFFVSEAQAVSEDAFFDPANQSPLSSAAIAAPEQQLVGLYVGGAGLVVLLALLAAYFLVLRKPATAAARSGMFPPPQPPQTPPA